MKREDWIVFQVRKYFSLEIHFAKGELTWSTVSKLLSFLSFSVDMTPEIQNICGVFCFGFVLFVSHHISTEKDKNSWL